MSTILRTAAAPLAVLLLTVAAAKVEPNPASETVTPPVTTVHGGMEVELPPPGIDPWPVTK